MAYFSSSSRAESRKAVKATNGIRIPRENARTMIAGSRVVSIRRDPLRIRNGEMAQGANSTAKMRPGRKMEVYGTAIPLSVYDG